MPLTVPHTFGTNDVLLAEYLQDNSDEIKQTLEKLTTPDVSTDEWVRAEHIMRGDYNPIMNRGVFVSAIMAGSTFNNGVSQPTYATVYNTQVVGGGERRYVPKSSVSFEMTFPGTMFFQYWACPISMDNQDADVGASFYTELAIYQGNSGLPQAHSKVRSIEEDHHIVTGFPFPLKRYFLAGSSLVDIVNPGTYNVGLVATSKVAKTVLVAWGYSVEFLHL
jgi:hypothetical protein